MAEASVMTVCGPVAVTDLGRTLMHEHLYVAFAGAELERGARFERDDFIRDAVRRLLILKEFGVKTFVDPSPIDLGRRVDFMQEISEKSGINIVCMTGFYTERLGIPAYWRLRTTEEIAELFIREIEEGIGESGIRAGAIKCASGGQNPSDLEEMVLRAVALAHKATGVPIFTHTENLGGSEQQDVLRDNGVPMHRCLIGHCCNNVDRDYHLAVVRRGSYIGFDRIGLTYRHPDEVHADNVVALFRAGYGHRIMLSQDRYVLMLGKPFRVQTPAEQAQVGVFEHLFTVFLPLLKERGLDDADIALMLDDNPRRFFAGQP